MPDVNFQEVADYFNLTSLISSLSSLNGQTTGSAENKAKFTLDDFDVTTEMAKKRSVNPSVAAIVGIKSPARATMASKKYHCFSLPKKEEKGHCYEHRLHNNGSRQVSSSSNKDQIKVEKR